jgi:glutaminyl-tRNA synthetase
MAEKGRDFREFLNPNSLIEVQAMLEPGLKHAKPEDRYQFERQGYFFADPKDSSEGAPVFNRIVTLRDTWAKIMQKDGGK